MRIFRLRESRSGFRQIDFRFLSDALQRAFVISCAQFPTWQRWASLSVGVGHLFGNYRYRIRRICQYVYRTFVDYLRDNGVKIAACGRALVRLRSEKRKRADAPGVSPTGSGQSGRLGQRGGVAELAYAGDLKSSAARIVGSSPTAPTIVSTSWGRQIISLQRGRL